MSTFYQSDSPLLGGQTFPQLFSSGKQDNINEQYNAYRQQLMNNYMAQQLQTNAHDYLSDLENMTKDLDRNTIERLNSNFRYTELSAKLQNTIQTEIMTLVKTKINSNQEMVDLIREEMEIIKKTKNEVKEEERNNYYEMQDYLKNYSHLTFDDYKKLQNKKIVEKEVEYES